MVIEDPDLLRPPTADRIREASFATVRRGYDPNQVLRYLGRVADHVRALEDQVRELESELPEAHRQRNPAARRNEGAPTREPYERVSAHLTDLLRNFDLEVDRLRREAEGEADAILAEARSEADRLRLDIQAESEAARARAERALQDARAQANRVLLDLSSRRQAVLDELRLLHDRLVATTRDLAISIESGPAADEIVILGVSGEGETVGKGKREPTRGSRVAGSLPRLDD